MVDDLLDWLIDKQRQGWKMVDSIPRLQNMKVLCAVKVNTGVAAPPELGHRAHRRHLAPCFPMYNAKYELGHHRNPKFQKSQLAEMKQGCEPNCFSNARLQTCVLLQHDARPENGSPNKHNARLPRRNRQLE